MADYEFINPTLELPALWQRLARNVLDWGDRFYKADEFADALTTYRAVVEAPGGGAAVFADSPLYKHARLKIVGDTVPLHWKDQFTFRAGAAIFCA